MFEEIRRKTDRIFIFFFVSSSCHDLKSNSSVPSLRTSLRVRSERAAAVAKGQNNVFRPRDDSHSNPR